MTDLINIDLLGQDWSKEEVNLLLSDYFSMLLDELSNRPYNKALHRRNLLPFLNNRSESSIEFKHQNVSAVLIKLGLPYIKGYKPRWNFQTVLENWTVQYLAIHKPELEPQFNHFADSIEFVHPHIIHSQDVLERAPEPQQEAINIVSEPMLRYGKKLPKIDYLAREQRNRALGKSGEEFVLDFERRRLMEAGRETWAEKIEWVSINDDGAGFDILSKNDNGTDRYIEVKTTKLSKEAPIYFSQNEYSFSQRNREQYHLYRVFNFSASPKLFITNGSFDDFCRKEPITFKGIF